MDIKKRNSALDLIRIVALFLVISVHFFLNSGFYSQIVCGKRMYVMTVMRSAFMICVPLFMILTGYLKKEKSLSKQYYKGIIKIVGIYILASLCCIAYKKCFSVKDYSFKSIIFGILDFSAANYSWYIEMYLGLFLLAPFLNILYNNIENRKHKKIFLITLIILTSIPSVINIFNFESIEWWKCPALNQNYQKLIPNWWVGMFPITYYFIGCYLKEYGIKLKRITNIFLIFLVILVNGTFNYYRSYESVFISGPYQNYESLLNVILSVLVFILLSNIDFSNCNIGIRSILAKLSDLCLGAYLVSSNEE